MLAPKVEVERRADGSLVLRSPAALGSYDRHLGVRLRHWAKTDPDRVFLAERNGDGPWRRLSYGEAATGADAVAQALLDRGLGPERPVMILSGNSIDQALLTLGAMQAGIPVAPVSPAYSLMSQDFAKLKHIAALVKPGMIYVAAVQPFARALEAVAAPGIELVCSAAPPEGRAATRFADLLATRPTPAVERAFAAIGPDSVAKYLFTSGSTGLPKGVINTQRMLNANQQMAMQCWPFMVETPPVLLDWLPWNHTFGGNHNFNMVLRHGGTLYIDAGRPMPGLIERTVANLREVSPTIHFNVPAGFAMLLPFLERDAEVRRAYFRRLGMIFYAGAALPQDLWSRLETVARQELGRLPLMISSWGSTETAPMATTVHWRIDRAGVIGLPAPGVEVKMVPAGAKTELRVRGPNVFPGYLGRPDLTAAAFDDEGFYRMGDAGRFADPADPAKGIVFDGRVAEDFKLVSGTWVSTGGVRVAALAAASPALQDAVVTGHDRAEIGLLAWPNLAACRALARDLPADAPPAALIAHEAVRDHVRKTLAAHNAAQSGGSMRIGRVLLLAEPPSIDANEITDKGYINQLATLERRAAEVAALYAEPPGPAVIRL